MSSGYNDPRNRGYPPMNSQRGEPLRFPDNMLNNNPRYGMQEYNFPGMQAVQVFDRQQNDPELVQNVQTQQMQQFPPQSLDKPENTSVDWNRELPPRRRRPQPEQAINDPLPNPINAAESNQAQYTPLKRHRGRTPPYPASDNDRDLPMPGEPIMPIVAPQPGPGKVPKKRGKKGVAAAAKKELEGKEKGKIDDGNDKRGGRVAGARNFSVMEMVCLVRIIGNHKPIGANGWDAVARDYKEWAVKNGVAERDKTSLKHKFDVIVRTATEKPTGEGERLELYEEALRVDDAITARAATITLDDDASVDKDSTISLTDGETGSDEEKEVKPVHKEKSKGKGSAKTDKSLVTVKSYKTTDPLDIKPRRTNAAAAQANEAMGSIGSFFKPESVRERDESRSINALQHAQLLSTQAELREVRGQYAALQERFYNEGRRADREARRADQAESECKMLKTVYEMSSGNSSSRHRRRRRHDSSDSDSPRQHAKRRHSSPVRQHVSVASSSKHTLDDDDNSGSIFMKMTPKKNGEGRVTAVELSPA